MPRLGKIQAKVERHKIYGTPHKIYDIVGKPRKGKPQLVARAFLRAIARSLRIDENLRDLKFDKVLESPLGTHVLFQQLHQGKRITGAWIKVDLDQQNRVYHVVNSCIPQTLLQKTQRKAKTLPWTEKRAIEKALTALGVKSTNTRGHLTVERVMFPVGKRIQLAWKIIVPVARPPHDWRIYVSATDGSILHQEDMLKMAAVGWVFDPNPVVTLNDATLRESKPLPDSAYHQVELVGVPSTGYLDGPYVTTAQTKKRVRRKDGKFLFKRTKPGFKEVMVYFHIDRLQRYIQSLGFHNVNRRSIPVNVAGTKEDNSFYSPATQSLNFGTGGVDDAEDAEVILHEYGHSIQDHQVPGFGASEEAGAMGEGFGDYLAASFFADVKPARMRTCVASWDATAYSPEDPPCLRRVDSNKRYPRDVVGEVHADGEIWSACLWQIREALGRQTSDILVLAHHFLIKRDASFQEAAQALRLADRKLYGGTHEKKIQSIFTQRGILKSAQLKRAGYDPFRRSNRPGRAAL